MVTILLIAVELWVSWYLPFSRATTGWDVVVLALPVAGGAIGTYGLLRTAARINYAADNLELQPSQATGLGVIFCVLTIVLLPLWLSVFYVGFMVVIWIVDVRPNRTRLASGGSTLPGEELPADAEAFRLPEDWRLRAGLIVSVLSLTAICWEATPPITFDAVEFNTDATTIVAVGYLGTSSRGRAGHAGVVKMDAVTPVRGASLLMGDHGYFPTRGSNTWFAACERKGNFSQKSVAISVRSDLIHDYRVRPGGYIFYPDRVPTAASALSALFGVRLPQIGWDPVRAVEYWSVSTSPRGERVISGICGPGAAPIGDVIESVRTLKPLK